MSELSSSAKGRELFVKFDEETSPKFGKRPSERTLQELFEYGFINLDKHAGPTSHECVDMLKKVLGLRKAGHSGTLDPQVTGVLLTGLGRATRLMEFMLESNKEYVCLMYLHKGVSDAELDEAFKKFTGKILQTPPVKSAVKRQERPREIYSMKVLGKTENNQYVLFRVACEHGTYIRKLCSDMGDFLKVGGQMVELRRTKAGPITENDFIIGLDKLKCLYELYLEAEDKSEKEKFELELRKYIRPQEDLVSYFGKVYLRDTAVDSVCHGGDLAVPGIAKFEGGIGLGDNVAMLSLKGELVGIGTCYMSSEDIAKKSRGAVVKTSKVFMDPGVYPKYWKFGEEKKE